MYLDSLEGTWGTNRLYFKVGLDGVVTMKWELTQNLVEIEMTGGVNAVVNLHQLVHFKYTASDAQ